MPSDNSAGRAIDKYDMLQRNSPALFCSTLDDRLGLRVQGPLTDALQQVEHCGRKCLRSLLRRVVPHADQLTSFIAPAEKPCVLT